MGVFLETLRNLGTMRVALVACILAAFAWLFLVLSGNVYEPKMPLAERKAVPNVTENIAPQPTYGLDTQRITYENRLARIIETLLERYLGAGKVRAEVTVEVDRNHTIENADYYDPTSQVVRSSQSKTLSDKSPRAEESIRYEISRTTLRNTKEAGGIKRISAAVVVDGSYTIAPDGTQAYVPRSPEELAQLTRLIQSAVGYSEARGDHIELINLQFAELPEQEIGASTGWFVALSQADLMSFIKSFLLVAFGLLVLFLGARFFFKWLTVGSEAQLAPEGTNGTPLNTSRTPSTFPAKERKDVTPLRKLEGLIDDNTDQAVLKVRNWLDSGGV